MSFDLNPLNNNTPQIRTSQTQDGGAGNTGYFQQKRKSKSEEERDKSVFGEKKDTFTLSDAKEMDYSEPSFLLKVISYFKFLFNRLLHQ